MIPKGIRMKSTLLMKCRDTFYGHHMKLNTSCSEVKYKSIKGAFGNKKNENPANFVSMVGCLVSWVLTFQNVVIFTIAGAKDLWWP